MTVSQVCTHFSTKIAAVLRAQEVDGSVLSTVTSEALQKVGMTVLQAERVIQKRDELLTSEKGGKKINVEDDSDRDRNDSSGQAPRRFLQVCMF